MNRFFHSIKNQMNTYINLNMSSGNFYFILGCIVLFFALIRLAGIGIPSLQWTDWKEIDYISISKNYLTNGFRIWEPTISWPAEPPRITAMEFPLVPFLSAVLYKFFGFNVITVRLITLLSFLLIIWFTGLLARHLTGPYISLIAAFFAGWIPLHSRFGNMQFTDPLLFAVSLMSLYFFYRYTQENKTSLAIWAFGLLSLALLLKPTELYIALPMVWIWFRKHLFNIKKWFHLAAFFSFAFILPVAWYIYVWHLTKTSIDVFGVFGGHDKFQTITMLSQKKWYAAMFHSVWSLLGGAPGFFLFITGAFYVLLQFRKHHLILVWLMAVGCFFVIVAEGNYDTPYRQLAITSVGAIIMALGSWIILSLATFLFPVLQSSTFRKIIFPVLLLTLLFADYKIIFHRTDAPVHPVEWEVASHIKKIAGINDRLITAGTYTIHKGGNDLSPVVYYYADKQGWTLQKGDWNQSKLQELMLKGGKIFAATYMLREPEMEKFALDLAKQYEVVYYANDQQSIVIDLRKPINP